MWHAKKPSLLNGHECRAYVKNLQPFTGNGDFFIWVKNSRVGWKTTNKQALWKVVFSPSGKGVVYLLFQQTWIRLSLGYCIPILGNIGLVVLDEKSCWCILTIQPLSPLGNGSGHLFYQTWIPFILLKNALRLWKIGKYTSFRVFICYRQNVLLHNAIGTDYVLCCGHRRKQRIENPISKSIFNPLIVFSN